MKSHVIGYRRERWLTPHGETLVAPLPTGIVGHFGPQMRRFVLAQYHQGQITVEPVTGLLRDLGLDISSSPVMKSLSDQSVSGATMMTSIAGLPSMFATMAIARAASN